MSIKPILLNTDTVRGILDWRTSYMLREVKPQLGNVLVALGWSDNKKSFAFLCDDQIVFRNPPYLRGDILWVRETWSTGKEWMGESSITPQQETEYLYKAGWTDIEPVPRWYSSIHMPREAARIFLRVVDVAVSRLDYINEITKERFDYTLKGFNDYAAHMEGVRKKDHDSNANIRGGEPILCINDAKVYEAEAYDPIRDFKAYQSRAVKRSGHARCEQDANPWVWVIAFERCEPPEGFYCEGWEGDPG